VNVDNVITTSDSGRTVEVTFTDNFVDNYIVPFATYDGTTATTQTYNVQATTTTAQITLYVRLVGHTSQIPQNGDKIYFAVFGRLA
jgi:hypothetical protein